MSRHPASKAISRIASKKHRVYHHRLQPIRLHEIRGAPPVQLLATLTCDTIKKIGNYLADNRRIQQNDQRNAPDDSNIP